MFDWGQHVREDEQPFTHFWCIWGSQAWPTMGVFYFKQPTMSEYDTNNEDNDDIEADYEYEA